MEEVGLARAVGAHCGDEGRGKRVCRRLKRAAPQLALGARACGPHPPHPPDHLLAAHKAPPGGMWGWGGAAARAQSRASCRFLLRGRPSWPSHLAPPLCWCTLLRAAGLRTYHVHGVGEGVGGGLILVGLEALDDHLLDVHGCAPIGRWGPGGRRAATPRLKPRGWRASPARREPDRLLLRWGVGAEAAGGGLRRCARGAAVLRRPRVARTLRRRGACGRPTRRVERVPPPHTHPATHPPQHTSQQPPTAALTTCHDFTTCRSAHAGKNNAAPLPTRPAPCWLAALHFSIAQGG